jgi:hypothetical protein
VELLWVVSTINLTLKLNNMDELKLILERLRKELETNSRSALHEWSAGVVDAICVVKKRIEELENKSTIKDEIKKLEDDAMIRDWEEQADNMIDEWINNPFHFKRNKGEE